MNLSPTDELDLLQPGLDAVAGLADDPTGDALSLLFEVGASSFNLIFDGFADMLAHGTLYFEKDVLLCRHLTCHKNSSLK
jgi:hypothetical protein